MEKILNVVEINSVILKNTSDYSNIFASLNSNKISIRNFKHIGSNSLTANKLIIFYLYNS